jgi:hypothetical protein
MLTQRKKREREIVSANETHLRFEVPMDVTEFVKLCHTREHLSDVESCMFLLEDARVVEESTEVAAGDEVLRALER